MPRATTVSTDSILAAAEQLFASQGFGATSLRQLISASGVSPTAFYARYDSKSAVLEALVERMLGRVLAMGSATFAPAATAAQAADDSVALVAAAIVKHKVVVKLALTEAPTIPTLRTNVRGAYTAMFGLVHAYLLKRGAPIADPSAAAWMLLGAGVAHLTRWAVFEELDDEQFLAEFRAMTRLSAATFP